jgi:hypothetical protein
MRTRTIRLRHVDGQVMFWTLYRDAASWWIVEDHNGYARVLERTLANSIPKLMTLIDNHGCELLTGIYSDAGEHLTASLLGESSSCGS